MIKRHTNLLLLITAVFTAFTLGFFTGRNYNASPVQISHLTPVEDTAPTHSQLVLQAPQTEAAETVIATVPATTPPEIPDTTPAETTPPTETVTPTTSAPKATSPATTTAQTQETGETSSTSEATQATEAPVPTETPTEAETVPDVTEEAKSGLININTASAAELMTLPGIGEVLSQRIVEYRETYGPFPSVAALTNVSGIGEKRLAAIIHLITV